MKKSNQFEYNLLFVLFIFNSVVCSVVLYEYNLKYLLELVLVTQIKCDVEQGQK